VINKKYTVAIDFSKSQDDVFNHLLELSKWWPEEFLGDQINLNKEFVFRTGDGHYSKNKVIEFVPNKKVVWLVTESIRTADNFDWSGTKMMFELAPKTDGTSLTFSYDGPVLEAEQDRLAQICDFCIKDKLYNFIESFTATIEVEKSPQEVFNCIKDVSKWWGGNDLEGSVAEFTIHHPNAHFSKQKLIELIPNQKIGWLITEATLHWLQKDKHEWANTKVIFEIKAKENKTEIHFTHEGLVPRLECYSRCAHDGWAVVIRDNLFKFITEGKTMLNN